MKIHFILNERVHAQPNPVFVAAMQMLERRGFAVTGGIPEEALLSPDRLWPEHDLYVLKSQTELALSVAGMLHDRGARIVNSWPACVLLQDKITAAGRLAAAQVPVPRSWITADFDLLRDLVAIQPLIVKPYRGHRGAGIVVVRSPADLGQVPRGGPPMLVQQLVESGSGDVKLYVARDEVFAVRKTFSAGSFRATGEPCAVTPRLRDIALRCGRAFGLCLYGVDIVEGPEGPVVVDLNYSPGFRGVPDAVPAIARVVEDCARGRGHLPVQPPVLHGSLQRSVAEAAA